MTVRSLVTNWRLIVPVLLGSLHERLLVEQADFVPAQRQRLLDLRLFIFSHSC